MFMEEIEAALFVDSVKSALLGEVSSILVDLEAKVSLRVHSRLEIKYLRTLTSE